MNATLYAVLALILFYAAAIAAWLTHVVACIKAGAMLFLLIGGLIAPIGIVHGVGIWMGVW